MNKDLKQEFTRRITEANKSELVVIMFEMFHQYCLDAIEAAETNNYSDLHVEIKRARNIVSSLISALNYQYELSNNLYRIYRYVERDLIKADVKRDGESIKEALRLMDKLKVSFNEMAKNDTDGPMMQNTETIYAGMTYGKGSIMEMSNVSSNRGFFA